VRERQVLSPLDLERRFGISGGNIFHGEMSLDQMFFLRPVAAGRVTERQLPGCGCAARARIPAAA
jgi:phytoene dehydrogenase-like protein